MTMRLIAVYHKEPALRFISHLDVQRTLHRALVRAAIPVRYSAGFNPHPLLSFATALSTGMAGDAEYFDVQLCGPMLPAEFEQRLNAVLPQGFFVSDAMAAKEGMGSLAALLRAASYEAVLHMEVALSKSIVQAAVDSLLEDKIMVNKRTKKGLRPVDIRPQILKVSVERVEDTTIVLHVLGRLQADGGLRTELLLSALLDRLGVKAEKMLCRRALYFDPDGPLPRLPQD